MSFPRSEQMMASWLLSCEPGALHIVPSLKNPGTAAHCFSKSIGNHHMYIVRLSCSRLPVCNYHVRAIFQDLVGLESEREALYVYC